MSKGTMRCMILVIASLTGYVAGNYTQQHFDILQGSKVVNVVKVIDNVSLIECGTECTNHARENYCTVAGYYIDTRLCQIAADNLTSTEEDSNYVIIKVSGECGTNLETDYINVRATYPGGTQIGATATVTCALGYQSNSGITSWTFTCEAIGKQWHASQTPDCVWGLIFRSTAGNGYHVYNAFYYGDVKDGVTNEEGCTDVYNTSCTLNYRSPKVDTLFSLDIAELSYEMYNSTSNVLTLRFNGTGSTIYSWFSPFTVIDHPWNISKNVNTYWDLKGISDSMYGRYFRVSTGYFQGQPECAHQFYTVVFYPTPPICSYDNFTYYPQFTYTTSPGGAIYSTEPFYLAQTMGIWVKYNEEYLGEIY